MERLKTKFVKLEHNQIRLFKESEQQKKRKGHLQIIIANLAQSSNWNAVHNEHFLEKKLRNS